MASPLRSWSPLRVGVAASERRRRPDRGRARRTAAGTVEPLEGRQLFAASLVSLDTTGLSSGNADSVDPDISSDGRYVVFASRATDLVPADTNTNFDVYLRDTQTGVTRLVSVAAGGTTPGGAGSTDPSVSDDGRFVAFVSDANNLVAGDNNNRSDVFVRDMFLNETRLVSANLTNTGPGNGNSLQPSISDDGRFVAFTSEASNIASSDLNVTRDVFLRNLENSTTSLVSIATTGAGGDLASQAPFVSADGRFVAFVSEATNLPAGPGAAGADVYLRSIEGASTTIVSTTTGLTGGLADVGTGAPTVSDDGRFVAFSSAAADLFLGDANGVSDVFRKDLSNGTLELVSQSTAGVVGNGASVRPKISADGRFVAFSSVAGNLAAPDAGPGSDVFIRDVEADLTFLVSANRQGTGGTGSSSQPAMTDDGRIVAFASEATNVVIEDTANVSNVFIATTPIPGNDTAPPTLLVPPQPVAPQLPEVGEAFIPFTVIYSDTTAVDAGTLGANDVVVTGPNGYSETATLFALTSTNNTSATVAYTVPAPGGTLSAADNGTYTITVRGQQVGDVNRNFVPAGTAGSIVLDLPISETVLPAPTFIGGSPAVGAQTYEFTVIYDERGGIDFATFGNDDLQVVGPNGFSQNAAVVSNTPLNATQTSVIYRITAPGGTWDANDAGVYSVNVLPGGVRDVGQNPVGEGTFGQFTALGADVVAIPLRNLRTGAISGVDQQRAKIRILNQGTFTTEVPVAVTLYTSLDQTLDAADATIGTFIEERPIPADQFRDLRVRFTYPQVAEGNYYVIAQVDSANAVVEQSETNNVAASFGQVGLSAPFADLVPTLVPFADNRSRLGTNEVTLRIRNGGNVTATGDILVGLTAVSDVTPVPQERNVATVPLRVTLRPGQTRTFRVPFNFPIEFERGTYRMVATVDSTNIIPERDDANNRVISLSSFNFA